MKSVLLHKRKIAKYADFYVTDISYQYKWNQFRQIFVTSNTSKFLQALRSSLRSFEANEASKFWTSMPTSNQLSDVRDLCNIKIKAMSETAVAPSNGESLLYGDRQSLDIVCKETENGTATSHSPTVEGLVRMFLPIEKD